MSEGQVSKEVQVSRQRGSGEQAGGQVSRQGGSGEQAGGSGEQARTSKGGGGVGACLDKKGRPSKSLQR